MNNVQSSLANLDSLVAAGLLSQPEYATRRKALLDSFVGAPVAPAAGMMMPHQQPHRGPMRGGPGPMRGGGWGSIGGRAQGPYGNPHAGSPCVKIQPVVPTTTSDMVAQALSVYGTVVDASIQQGDPWYAYATFADPSMAMAAANQAIIINGTQTTIRHTKPKKMTKPPTADSGPTAGLGLFNLPFDTTQQSLVEHISTYPGYVDLRMVNDRESNTFRGFCFVDFDSVENATAAKDAMVGMTVGDKAVSVKYATPRGGPVPAPIA